MSRVSAGISRRGFVRSALLGACSVPEVADDGLASVIEVYANANDSSTSWYMIRLLLACSAPV